MNLEGKDMTTDQFAYWLQGFAELNEAPPTPEQWKAIREHLALVFHKVTPPLGGLRFTPTAPVTAPYFPPQSIQPAAPNYTTVTC